jgi:hypothetical protein
MMGSINAGQPGADNQDIEVLKRKHWSWHLEACYSIRAVSTSPYAFAAAVSGR